MADITSIAIIGGGASGTISAIHLLNEFKGPLKIYLIEKMQKALFRGAAYSSTLEFENLNVPVGKMSIFSDEPDDFYDWLLSKRRNSVTTPITRESFVSRRWFGDYLAERLVEAKAAARKASIEIIVAEVTDILFDKKSCNYQLKLSNDNLLAASKLIFATGNEAPADILSNLEKAIAGDRYIQNPWVANPFENLSPDNDVLIIGTGLSMIDHALSLYSKDHRGKIYSFSRHGLLPLPQHVGAAGQVLPPASKELLPLLKGLRNAAAEGQKQELPWQEMINSLRDHTRHIWQGISVDNKKIFLRRLKTYWEIHRHRIPTESVSMVNEMIKNKKLELLAGKYQELSAGEGKLLFRFVSKGTGKLRTININRIINCTGPSGNYSQGNNWLIRSLLAKGWMKEDELKLGIVTGYNGEIITGTGKHLPNAYAIGPLRKAMEWESTAIREIKIQAEQLALDIALSYTNQGYSPGCAGSFELTSNKSL